MKTLPMKKSQQWTSLGSVSQKGFGEHLPQDGLGRMQHGYSCTRTFFGKSSDDSHVDRARAAQGP